MVFACQKDSYLRRFRTRSVSCEPSTIKIQQNGRNEKITGFNVVLEDTVLFPEGGGQPDDRGTMNGQPVLRITRQKDKAIHFVTKSFDVGEEVDLEVDWVRRFDHMQQHSGQHLLSAIAENEFDMKTTSWNLGEQVSFVELDIPSIEPAAIKKLEEILNEKIRAAIPMRVKTYEEGAAELEKAHTRGLPEDHRGPVRIVSIEGIDDNMCCGTHVSNLSELQVIKLLSAEKGKKNKTNLHFLVGDRVLRSLQNSIDRERAFTSILKGGSEQHVDLLEKMSKALKISQKNELSLIRDLALLEAQRIKSIEPRPSFYSLHRKEGNADFMSIIVNEIGDENMLLFLTVGEDRGAGQVTLFGKPELVSVLGPQVGQLLDGKGVAKANRYLGKVNNLIQRSKAEQLLKDALGLTNGNGDADK